MQDETDFDEGFSLALRLSAVLRESRSSYALDLGMCWIYGVARSAGLGREEILRRFAEATAEAEDQVFKKPAG